MFVFVRMWDRVCNLYSDVGESLVIGYWSLVISYWSLVIGVNNRLKTFVSLVHSRGQIPLNPP
jgi:hypothetical protein